MQNLNQLKNSFTWKPASKFIQFAFEEGGLRPFGRQDGEQEIIEIGGFKKLQKSEEHQEQQVENSYEPSNQVIDFQKAGGNNQSIQITVTGIQVVDEISRTNVFVSKAYLPTLSICMNSSQNTNNEGQVSSEKQKYIQLFLAQKSHNSEYQKYKIIKGGLRGNLRQKIKSQNVKFDKIRISYLSNPQKLPRLILTIYEQADDRRYYKTVMISDEFSVIDNHKVLAIDNIEHLRQYFEPILIHFLDKSGVQVSKINTLNKHKVLEEMGTFENYLIKKNKKIWNIVYAAHKYSHMIDLYFYNPENKPKKEQFLELWKEVIQVLKAGEIEDGERTCNHLDPTAKFVLKIHASMRNVRFVINKQMTKYLSIVASESQFDHCNKWQKFDTPTQLKQSYIICQTQIQSKLISEPIISKTTPQLPSIHQSSPMQSQAQQSQPQKKVTTGQHSLPSALNNPNPNQNNNVSKNDDDDFNEEDVQDQDDDVQYDGQSSENYSVSNRKRGRKLGQKKIVDVKKSKDMYGRDNKCTTRGGNRTRNKQDTEDSNEKKAILARKKKQKEAAFNNRVMPTTSMIGNPPFRILTPAQAGQYKDQQTQSMQGKMIGIMMNPASGMMNPAAGMMNPATGMMINAKKPEDPKTQPMGIPKGVVPMMMPAGMNPQMMAMMGGGLQGGMQMMPMGNGMQAVMMPMPMDKGQQPSQGGMPTMMTMGGMPGMTSMGGMPAMGGMPNMGGMMPFMMGGGTQGMPQGFVMPTMMGGGQQQTSNQQSDKSKQQQEQQDKQKQAQKKDQKKQGFPPQTMQAIDFSKMAMMGQMPGGMSFMPAGQMGGMQMPQHMQMGMPSMAMMGGSGMPQGMMMNPMMAMQKQQTDNKDQQSTKSSGSMQQGSMQNPMMAGGMPFMMAQMPTQMQGSETSSQTPSGMQMSMMGQFPGMMQMPQQGQMGSNPGQGQGMPMGYTMVMNPDQARSMTPSQMQQMQMQMQMMMSKGMMPMMQVPKGDNNDQGKK